MSDIKHKLDENSAESAEKKAKLENPQRKPEEPVPRSKGIQEEDVGICRYISQSNNGFSGILKQRYYDFLVNEIDTNGEEVHLTDEGVQNRREKRKEKRELEKQLKEEPEEPKVELPAQPEQLVEQPAEQPVEPAFQLSSEHRIALLETFGEEDLTKIEQLFVSEGSMESSKAFNDKSERGKIHQLLRVAFEGKLDSSTSSDNKFQVKFVTKKGGRNRNNQRDRKNQQENAKKDRVTEGDFGLGPVKDHLLMTMYKENKETMEVGLLLAKFLRIPTKWIRYAGTKDRRGVTVQRISIENMRASRINNLNKILKGIRLGSFAYSDVSLGLGDLSGNSFVITVKDVVQYDKTRKLEDVVKDSVTSLLTNGFINYFGMQRFGTFSISTHAIGVKLLQGKWKEAAELLLSEQELVSPDSVEARKIWAETKKASLALSKMPRRCSAEHSILESLSREKTTGVAGEYPENAYFVAIMKIPRNLRIMYAHAYQSYVWNCVVSKRMELFGMTVVEGDLVVEDLERDAVQTKIQSDDEDVFEEDVKKDIYTRARPVTLEEVQSGKFTIYDIVLPTPGFDVVYPTNPVLKQVYTSVMEADGLDPDNMFRKVREFSLSGSYRNIVSRATKVEYYLRKYDSNDQTLVKTDLDVLRLNQAHQKAQIDELVLRKEEFTQEELEAKIEEISKLPPIEVSRIEDGSPEGAKTAVIVKMQLGVSSYATMLLRELMKKDTSRRGEMCDVTLSDVVL